MKLVILTIAILWASLLLAAPAMAACTTYTVMGADGKMQFCQSCCVGGQCQVSCV